MVEEFCGCRFHVEMFGYRNSFILEVTEETTHTVTQARKHPIHYLKIIAFGQTFLKTEGQSNA